MSDREHHPKDITPTMLADVNWLYRTLLSIEAIGGSHPNKLITKEVVGRSKDFALGAHWAREIYLKEKFMFINKYSGVIARLRLELDSMKKDFEGGFDS